MISEESQATTKAGFPAFAVTSWILGLIVLAQLLISGMALAVRLKESQVVKVVEKEIYKPVWIEAPRATDQAPPAEPLAITPPPPVVPEVPELQPSPLLVPSVEDPRSERLLMEARQARVAGDMGKSIVKLEQALVQSPDDASVLYELGVVHEQMGVFDKASEYFERVFQMGVSKAGSLYEMAAAKLRDGVAQPEDMLGKLSLGRVRIFNNPKHSEGQQVILTIPVQKAPANEVNMAEIQVEVRFFVRTKRGDIVELNEPSWVVSRWVSMPFDWAGGEESLRMTYTIPSVDRQTSHLFGSRDFYGQVVTLSYQGAVFDVQAWPRDLAAKIVKQPEAGFGELLPPDFQDTLPPDFDPSVPLLPSR